MSPLPVGFDLLFLHSEPVPPSFPPSPPFFSPSLPLEPSFRFLFFCFWPSLPLRLCFPLTIVLLLASSSDSNNFAASSSAIYIIKKTKTAVKFRFLNFLNMAKNTGIWNKNGDWLWCKREISFGPNNPSRIFKIPPGWQYIFLHIKYKDSFKLRCASTPKKTPPSFLFVCTEKWRPSSHSCAVTCHWLMPLSHTNQSLYWSLHVISTSQRKREPNMVSPAPRNTHLMRHNLFAYQQW